MCVIPEYVPPAQHGTASGLVGMANVAGGLAGSAVGFLAGGGGGLSLRAIYLLCAAANIAAGLAAAAVLLDRPLPPPPPAAAAVPSTAADAEDEEEEQEEEQETEGAPEGGGRRLRRRRGTTGFLSSFRSAPFAALFVASTVGSVGPIFLGTFVQYYLADRVQLPPETAAAANGQPPPGGGFRLFGVVVATTAESASAVYMTCLSLASAVVVLPAGLATHRCGGRQVGPRVPHAISPYYASHPILQHLENKRLLPEQI